MKGKMPSMRAPGVSARERQSILARIRRIGIESGRTNNQLKKVA